MQKTEIKENNVSVNLQHKNSRAVAKRRECLSCVVTLALPRQQQDGLSPPASWLTDSRLTIGEADCRLSSPVAWLLSCIFRLSKKTFSIKLERAHTGWVGW
jgi:hypothetical protein